MSLFEEVKHRVETDMSPNQTRITQATALWLSVLCDKIDDRLESIQWRMNDKIEDLERFNQRAPIFGGKKS